MKTIISKLIPLLLIAGCLLFTLPFGTAAEAVKPWDGESTASGFQTGSGSFGDPYVISTPEEFNYFAMFVSRNGVTNKKYFVLENDLDFGGNTISPVGSKSHVFAGTFDGRGHVISNFRISSSETGEYVGLFGYVKGDTAVVKNFTLRDASISSDQKIYIGAVSGFLTKGTISGIILEDTVSVTVRGETAAGSTGGVVGRNYGLIEYVTSSAKITHDYSGTSGSAFVGGIAGVTGNGGAVISNCYVNGEITATRCEVGGISGIVGAGNGNGSVKGCVANVKISSGASAGGVLGKIHTDAGNELIDCTNLSTSITGPAETTGSIIGNISKNGIVTGNATVNAGELPKYGTGYNQDLDLSTFGLEEVTAEEAQARLTALQEKIASNAKAESEIKYEDAPAVTDPEDPSTKEPTPQETQPTPQETKPTTNNGMGNRPNTPQNTTANTQAPTTPVGGTTETPSEKESGCGATASLLAVAMLLGMGLTVLKRDSL
ncbi:MAG: hypothetical protein E7620_06480 [Ruminococcaceae bacterium]|nr:hypothetical protein [Oscillospiraceae bacterium]